MADYLDMTLKIDKAQFSLYELKRKYEKGREIILNPDFQRGDAWEGDREKSALIESILLGLPIPLFYFFENQRGGLEVIDGRQRITTILDFFANQFAFTYLEYLPKLNTLYFKDLSPRLQAKIEDYQIHITIIQPPTPERIKFDIFERINRRGTALSAQEIRNGLYQGSMSKLLASLSQKEIFKNATDTKLSSKSMQDREWILHFFYIYLLKVKNFKFDYPYDKAECLADTMKLFNKEEDLTYLEEMFIKAMTLSYKIFSSRGFKFKNKEVLNLHLFETLCYLYMILEENQNLSALKIKIEDIKQDFEVIDEFYLEDLKDNQFRFSMIEDLKDNND